jgi:hypothetical protein
MPEPEATQAQAAKPYPALLWHDIKSRKSEFFVGLLLSILSSIATVWLQYRDGMLERKHFWDGIVTSAIPVLSIVVVFALVEVYRAAASLHREGQAKIKELETRARAATLLLPTETAEERYWNLRTQAEGPELAMKILRGGNPGPAESKPKPEFDFTYSSANSLFDPPRSDTYRLRLFNRAEATTVDDVRVRVMSIPTDKQWAGVLPVGLRAQHGGEAPFTLNGTSPLLIDLLEYSAEKMPQIMTTWSEVIEGQRQTSSRMVQHVLLCTDSRSPQVIIDCGEGKIHDITIEVQGRNIQTCLKTFRVRSLLPNRGADGSALEITEV